MPVPLRQHPNMVGETKKQFFLTRVVLQYARRAKAHSRLRLKFPCKTLK
jgi:hypothetical protein